MRMSTIPLVLWRMMLIVLLILWMTIFVHTGILAAASGSASDSSSAAAMNLVHFCTNPETGFDLNAAATLVDYVLSSKSSKEVALPKIENATGAYYEFDTRIGFSNFLQYLYNSKIPSALMSPASLRYSLWTDLSGEVQKLPGNWPLPLPGGKPVIIYGLQRDGITPDLTTGVYYEYDLKRTLILLNHKGRPVLISISRQIDISDVGKKGFILGNDDDWNYYYSGEPGSAKSGLGWVKSYIYSYFSVAVYVDSGSSPAMVRSGVFQWIRAGWSGINFVQTEHVIKGMKRHSRNLITILESPDLPAPMQMASANQKLRALPQNDLVEKYSALQQARQSLAVANGKIMTNEIKKREAYANTPKEQIVEELMLEYLKTVLGKPSLFGKKNVLNIH